MKMNRKSLIYYDTSTQLIPVSLCSFYPERFWPTSILPGRNVRLNSFLSSAHLPNPYETLASRNTHSLRGGKTVQKKKARGERLLIAVAKRTIESGHQSPNLYLGRNGPKVNGIIQRNVWSRWTYTTNGQHRLTAKPPYTSGRSNILFHQFTGPCNCVFLVSMSSFCHSVHMRSTCA